jgi:aminoglycoside phosphotransferase (APT) family kinase protein
MLCVDPDVASRILTAQFPALLPVRVHPLGEGCDFIVFDVNDSWVVRFPKTDEAEAQLDLERRLLPLLASELCVPVPQMRFVGQPCEEFPRSFGGYGKLRGEPAIRRDPQDVLSADVVARLGEFLSTLHAFPVEVAVRMGIPEQSAAALIGEVRADALDDLSHVRDVSADAPVDAWRAFLDRGVPPVADEDRPALIHNDLAAEHVLIDPDQTTITGVIDWSDVAIGDPAADFAGLFHWGGERLVEAVLRHYAGSVDAAALRRARYLAACRGAMDVAFGVQRKRPEYVASGLRALHACAAGGAGGAGGQTMV